MEDDEIIKGLLEEPEQAFQRWYISVTPSKDPDLVLTGGIGPSPERIRELFDEWFSRRRSDLKKVLCRQLHLGGRTKNNKEIGEIALVALVTSMLAGSPWRDHIDPLATAAILVSTRAIDNLCQE